MLLCDLGSLYLEWKGMCSDWLGLEQERELWAAGYRWLAGLDEAGRGAWAGPVVAAAVVLPAERNDIDSLLYGVRDSKVLTPRQREALFPLIHKAALGVGVGMASSRFIDRWGIVPATRQAMAMAVHNLPLEPHYLLIDALKLPDVQLPQRALIKGDAHVLSIAAASIVAKVFRDRLMVALGDYYCGYGFAAHKGYGTAAHRAALQRLGPCTEHRMSFAPLRARVSAAC
jgi:ribonuclease HII